MKKLQFGEEKCHKIHIGCDNSICLSLSIDKWKVKNIKQMDISKSTLEDIYDGAHEIEDSYEEKYLGDVISKSGKNAKNIEARAKKGLGIMKQILSILEELCFGKHFFTVFKILRESLFLNSILLNSEVWYNMKKTDIEELEKVDNILLKKVLEVPSSTPTAILHLELGTVPIRFILKTRRLMFLHYALQEDENSLLHKFLMAQIGTPKEGDWWLSVLQDINDLKLEVTLYEIKNMTKETFKTRVKLAASQDALKWLKFQKLKLNKVKNISHEKLEIQPYFSSANLSTHQKKFLFTVRSRMLFLRSNFSHMHKDVFCQLCSKTEQIKERFHDSQQHSDMIKPEKFTIFLESKYQKRNGIEDK